MSIWQELSIARLLKLPADLYWKTSYNTQMSVFNYKQGWRNKVSAEAYEVGIE